MHPFHLHTNACNSSTRKELIPKKQKTASFLMPLFYKQTLSKLWNVENAHDKEKGTRHLLFCPYHLNHAYFHILSSFIL